MTDQEIIQKFADLENRIRYLEMTNGPAPYVTDATAWSTPPTQGCSQEDLMKASYHCTHEHP